MEVQKRRRIDDEEIENKQLINIMKDEEENEGTIVDDDEKVNAMGGGGSGHKFTAAKPWNPAFLPGDFENDKGQESVENNVVLDLNEDPDHEKKIRSLKAD
ncbi:hypothetical protein A4A49_52795 [Nicotiana attenuata]|uniref:Uncharacterized protein n=1 Tax=Nicotiana attenuata TaxID=49451 RepID=A0A1J6IKG9_NICAT|nr:hypothetical protein A4A49_52795 [Nicotiana attenuata]